MKWQVYVLSNNRNSNVRKLRQPIRINVGMIVFAFIFVYLFVYIIIYFTKEHVAIYEVVEKSISENNKFTAIAIRQEEVVNSDAAGYITYYLNNASRVAISDLVFSIDEGGSALEDIKENIGDEHLDDSDYLKIQEELNYYKKKYTNASFDDSYDFKNNVTNMVLEMNNSAIYDDLETLISNVGEDKLVINKAPKTGIVSYTIDGMEGLKADNIDSSKFDASEYKYTEIVSGDLLEKNAPAYKLVTDESWQMVITLDEKQYERIKDKKNIGLSFVKDDFSTNAGINTYAKDGVYYATLTLDRYMVNYIDNRYIDIELAINTATGLKIPNTSIVDKEFFVVPNELFVNGGNVDKPGLAVMSYKDNGELVTEFVQTDIYYSDEVSSYIDASLFEIGTKIFDEKNNSEYALTEKAKLTGVYNVNKGYCEFRKIEVLYETDEYSIVKKGTESDFSIAKFDHIVLDASVAVEQELIY